jgi:hypothetical protein
MYFKGNLLTITELDAPALQLHEYVEFSLFLRRPSLQSVMGLLHAYILSSPPNFDCIDITVSA